MSKTLEFFFDYASPYSYLASAQVEVLAVRTGVELRWRPFLLGAVFKATGNVPPISCPAKARYLFKDLAHWTQFLGLPPCRFPEAFPIPSIKANRLGLVAAEQGLIAPFSHAAFRAAFVDGKDLGDGAVLEEVARASGLEPGPALARIENQEIKDALRRNTEEAVARGAFGAPTFFVGEEMFFGNDRLMLVERMLRGA
ncbi:2-hydroxychromene-2-carboxylate isomerase [Stigmatella aurantiaca]|uniref:2-hydroxychromene-2-carboxylate isomerase n=1 Tax=Stigmatella aurantiaca (strain DW4/3-1) TaxID=378806 RepID=Q08QE2_STIAD|nr:2-hydroxychromene-2-carboxylate isomerase [Stigmatella aurantiaca]ADO72941.1 DSBA oxidoreductase [Stigmatella aurantiaca DW4/3-1]EAU62698.1 2-hydroxychromene-2-carboxylate isomerase family protein [Stigmatella aurantiaca DW4/3-1]